MKTYQSEISRIENLYDQGDTKNTVSECGILIERVVQMIFLDFHNHLNTPEERKTYLDLEIKWGTDYSSFIRRPTIGVSLRYYNQLLNAFPEHIRIVPEIKDDFNIINTLRNQVAHAGSAPPSDNDGYRSLRSTKKIINKLNMLQDESDNIFGLPLHIYLVYSSIKEKFKDAKNEADFEKIVSDADILLPELMNETVARRYIHFSDDQKISLVEIFMKNGNCDLDYKSCHEFFIDSGIIDIYGNDASELKDVFEDILMSKDNNSKKTRMSSRPYISAMNIMFNELSSTNAEKYHVLADRIKAHYLNDNQIDDQEKNALMENARMLNIDFETLDIFINNIVNEIEKHLIKYRTFVSENADTGSGDSEAENNLINMIKLGTPFEAVRALAAQLGYNGDIDKLFSKHSPAGKSLVPDLSVSSSEDKPHKKREGAKRFSMEEGNYSDQELEDALKEYFSSDGKTEGKIERRIKVRSYLKILLSEDRPFKRDELKQIINEKGLWVEAHERSGSNLGYSGYVGNQMSHVSKEFSNKNNDFLRQIISFDSLARAEVQAGEAGAKKDTFYLKKEYRQFISNFLNHDPSLSSAEDKPPKEQANDTQDSKHVPNDQIIKYNSLQEEIANQFVQLYPNAIIKKLHKDPYMDIHVPEIHPKRGTHVFFNTGTIRSKGIKVGFYCRDKEWCGEQVEKNPDKIEHYGMGIRNVNNPAFNTVEEALGCAKIFIDLLLS